MPNAADDRITASLTMCRRAGKLLLGFDAVRDASAAGTVCCILLAADTSPKTEKETRFFAGEIPLRKLPYDMDALAAFFRKRTAVFGVTEQGFARKLLSLLPEKPLNEQSEP